MKKDIDKQADKTTAAQKKLTKEEKLAKKEAEAAQKKATKEQKATKGRGKDIELVIDVENKKTVKRKRASRYKMSRGGRNLLILGIGSTLIAFITTAAGLAVYHMSGDIYLDRSRPGYLPDEAEVEEEAENEPEEYDFDNSGKLTAEAYEEYLKHLDEEVKAIDAYQKPFDTSVLSDEALGIPTE